MSGQKIDRAAMRGDKIRHGKLQNISWRYKNGVLVASEWVNRKFFGNFDIYFQQNPSKGTIVAWVENKDFPMLNRTKVGYENFEKALDGITAYFNDIEEKQKNISPAVELRAKQAYQKIIAEEIAKML